MSEVRRILSVATGEPRIVADDWRLAEAGTPWDGTAGAIVPLAQALADPDRLRAAGRAGLWLAADDDPARAADLLPALALVAVHFPKFTDGRGYSSAYLLRRRLGWRGELRAFGDVFQDQLFALRRVGFSQFDLRPGASLEAALGAFGTFSDVYQPSVDQALPAFRRPRTVTP